MDGREKSRPLRREPLPESLDQWPLRNLKKFCKYLDTDGDGEVKVDGLMG